MLVRAHRADDSLTRRSPRSSAPTVIIDDVGLLPVGPDGAEGLYRFVEPPMNANRRRSPPTFILRLRRLMPNTLATATVDRLLHHAHLRLKPGGDSAVDWHKHYTGRESKP